MHTVDTVNIFFFWSYSNMKVKQIIIGTVVSLGLIGSVTAYAHSKAMNHEGKTMSHEGKAMSHCKKMNHDGKKMNHDGKKMNHDCKMQDSMSKNKTPS